MTDTSRSLADIKTLFADNAAGQISPQDLRDGIESIANPLPGQGFAPPALRDRIGVFSFVNPVTVPATPSLGIGDAVAVHLRLSDGSPESYSYDPAGWGENSYSLAAADPENAWGIDLAAGDCLMIPPGIITIGANFITEAISYDGTRWVDGYFDQARFGDLGDGQSSDGVEPWFYEAYYNSLSFMRDPRLLENAGSVQSQLRTQVLVNDTDTEQPFALFFVMFNQTSDIDVTYVDLRIAWEPV